jgi:hypothetical protein
VSAMRQISPQVIGEIMAEIKSSQVKHGRNAMIRLDLPGGTLRRLAILGEEFGEVCKALTYDGQNGGTPTVSDLFGELTQTAAMAASWMQVLLDENPDLRAILDPGNAFPSM